MAILLLQYIQSFVFRMDYIMTFLEIAEKVLADSDKPLHYIEMWRIAEEKKYDEQLPKAERKTPWNTLSALMYKDVKYHADKTKFIKTEKGYFWLKSKYTDDKQLDALDAKTEEEENKKTGINKIKESDLHALLSEYLLDSKIYSKTINANATTSKKGEMKWGTPDVVGVLFREELKSTIRELAGKINVPTTEILAYELKIKLEISTFTECFFQALSNSGWANESWLVAIFIQDDPDFKLEMQRLNQAFGVGIIKLDKDEPSNSEVIFSAKKRTILDLDTINKLCGNTQFEDFFKDILDILETKFENRGKRIKEKMKTGNFYNGDI